MAFIFVSCTAEQRQPGASFAAFCERGQGQLLPRYVGTNTDYKTLEARWDMCKRTLLQSECSKMHEFAYKFSQFYHFSVNFPPVRTNTNTNTRLCRVWRKHRAS